MSQNQEEELSPTTEDLCGTTSARNESRADRLWELASFLYEKTLAKGTQPADYELLEGPIPEQSYYDNQTGGMFRE